MDDFEYQLHFVAEASWRILGMQDRNPLSPSHGCFHYSYWRDKTSEFPDARFQEAGAALGLLSLPGFEAVRDATNAPTAEALYNAFSAAVRFWARTQYPEGCWDEWYKGERGFAATEFTMIAYGLAAHYMENYLQPDDRRILVDTLWKAGNWLLDRHDRVKANHEAAAGAALALCWKATNDSRFLAAAKTKIDDALGRQKPEGWFPEIGGMDLGYSSVLLDYVMIYVLFSGDSAPVAAMKKLMTFMAPHIHPDCTISPEAGLCLNPYVSRIGMSLLSGHDDKIAGALVSSLSQSSPKRMGLLPYLADDLRLCRWSYLPIVTVLERDDYKSDVGVQSFADQFPQGWTINKGCALAAFHNDSLHLYFSIAGGGAVRIFQGPNLICEDTGLDVITGAGSWGSGGYSLERQIVEIDSSVAFTTGLGKAQFFYPGFLSRLILRLGSTTPALSRLLRSLIDGYRLCNGTAINQSAAPLAKDGDGINFERRVSVEQSTIKIVDSLQSAANPILLRTLRSNLTVNGTAFPVFGKDFSAHRVIVTKTLLIDAASPEMAVDIEHI